MTQTKAFAYLRTSSMTNVKKKTADKSDVFKDSDERQRLAIAACAANMGMTIVAEFYDPGVSGADPIDSRPGFTELLDKIDGNGVRTVIVEDASRFARDLMTQELGIMLMIQRGVTVLTANGENLTESEDDMRIAIRQVMGAFAQLEKQRLVKKLRAARERKKATGVKVEGKLNYSQTVPATVERAKQLAAEGLSLRAVAAALAEEGMLSEKGNVYAPTSIKNMLAS